MNVKLLYRFLRPSLFAVLCYLLAMLGSFLITQPKRSTENSPQPFEEITSAIDTLLQPDPALAPDEVVRIQVEGLAKDDEALGILQCMTFASPGNRSVTGPLERFGPMVRSAPFGVLSDPDQVLVGEPTFEDGFARVLVTLVNNRRLSSFVWVLSKQDQPPYQNCWMTDGVFPLQVGGHSEKTTNEEPDVTIH